MKHIRFIFIPIVVFVIIMPISLYAGVTFEVSGYGFGNMVFSLPSSNNNTFALQGTTIDGSPFEERNTDATVLGGFSLEGGALGQIGIFVDYASEFSGFSILGEAGMQYENMSYTSSVISIKNRPIRNTSFTVSTSFLTANAGIGAKVHFFENISIGVFAGVKFIVSPEIVTRSSSDGSINEEFERTTTSLIYPYAKITAEYAIPINNSFAIPIGIFFLFDGAQYLSDSADNRTFSVDLGMMLGVRYRYARSQ